MEAINIPQALQTLRDNYSQIETLGKEIEEKQNLLLLAQAGLMDAEETARELYFNTKPCKGFELRDWMKLETGKHLKQVNILAGQLQILKDKLRIIVECNNNVKMSFKILELDKQNTNGDFA